jgi:hypothetical protein
MLLVILLLLQQCHHTFQFCNKYSRKKSNVNDVVSALQQVSLDVIRGVIEEIERRAMTAGTVTKDAMEALFISCLEKSGLSHSQLAQRLENPPSPEPQPAENSRDNRVTMTHKWGERFNLVPRGFNFPNGCSLVAWQYWMCGDREKQYPPCEA